MRLKLLSYVIMAYMLLAFSWWAMLLFTKNQDAFHAKAELLKIGMVAEGRAHDLPSFERSAEYEYLFKKYQRQELMIFGEGAMFILTLLAGIWFVHRGYLREMLVNQQQRNFLLAITHELKSPIASIRLVLETLRKRDLPKPQADHLAASALKENERLLGLVENLLLSAKLETAYQPDFEEIDLIALINENIEKLKVKHPLAKVCFSYAENFPLVRIDRQGFTSVILNLLENGVKYAGENSELDIKLTYSDLHFQLEFADQGSGIPDKEKRRIFEKFYRIGNEETRSTKGTGLGLYIVKQIVEAHKGEIKVLDNLPKGAVFKIKLPFLDPL